MSYLLQVVATMDYGTTKTVNFTYFDIVDGDEGINYNCIDKTPERITVLIKEFLKNPTLLVGNDKGDLNFQSIAVDNKFTTKLVVSAEKLGEDYMMEKNVTADARITVLAKRADMSAFKGSNRVTSAELVYRNVFIFPLHAFLDNDYKFKKARRKGFDRKLIQQTRNLVSSIQGEPLCLQGFEQDYRNGTDVETPIFNRGKLLYKLRPKSNRALEFSDPEDQNAWVKLDFDDITEDYKWTEKLQNLKFVKGFAYDGTPDTFLEDLKVTIFDDTKSLAETKILLATMKELDKHLTQIYDLSTALEGGLVDIFDLIVSVLKIEPMLREIKKTLQRINIILSAVGVYPPIKVIVVVIRNAVKKLVGVVRKAMAYAKKIGKEVKPHKPKVKKLLNRNENFRKITAKITYVHENVLWVPTRTTHTCESTNMGAKIVNGLIEPVKSFFEPLVDLIKKISDAVSNLKELIAGVIGKVKSIIDSIVALAADLFTINKIFEPIFDVLNSPIVLSIPGPFCTKRVTTRVPYPCGIKYCRSCGFLGCIKYPCGVKICFKRVTVTLPGKICRNNHLYLQKQILRKILTHTITLSIIRSMVH
jgi:hypothetical protein